jgi:hypothetical protein
MLFGSRRRNDRIDSTRKNNLPSSGKNLTAKMGRNEKEDYSIPRKVKKIIYPEACYSMTAQQPELTEIIGVLAITEGFVPTAIRSEVMRLRERLEEFDRSRPHTPAPIRPIWECPTCSSVKRAEEEAARAATLKALSLLEEWDYHNNRNFGKPHPTFNDMIRLVRDYPEETRKHVESLRQQEEP